MAEAGVYVDQFSCSVCLELLKESVTIQCGHSYCKRHSLETQRKYQQKIQMREKETEELRKAIEYHKSSALAAVKDSRKIFTELICCIERKHSEIINQIRDQEKTVVSEAEGVLKKLEQEIADLRKRNTELEQLLHIEDHINFLQSLSTSAGSAVFPTIVDHSVQSFEDVVKSVFELRNKVEEFCKDEYIKARNTVKEIQIFLHSEPQSREDFLHYSCELTLDPNTVNKHLHLSEENTVVTNSTSVQPYPDHPDRFSFHFQVLCRESVSGRCYWEVEWSGDIGVYVSVSYKNISRKGLGYECLFGWNYQSWSLICSQSDFSFIHTSEEVKIPVVSSSGRVGVYVDYRAGTLSFYNISDTMTLLHKVHTTFTQNIYPGFIVRPGSTVKLIKM